MGEKQSAKVEKSSWAKNIRDIGGHEKVNFLGHEYSPEEYRIACKNLTDFFNILKKWAEKENSNGKRNI
jgi:hypothetical protein